MEGATTNAVTDPKGSPNRLLNVSFGLLPCAPLAPAVDVTEETAPRPAQGPIIRQANVRAPRLVAAKLTRKGLALRIRGRGPGYEVLVNGKSVARTTSTSPVIRTKLAKRGAKVQVRAYNSGGVSGLSNTVRL